MLVVSWGFDVLGLHRVQLEVLAANSRAQLYPDGWKDLILMGLLRQEYATGLLTKEPHG